MPWTTLAVGVSERNLRGTDRRGEIPGGCSTDSQVALGITNPTFTQEDPIGLAGGLNLYGFAGGDPINFWDPFGLEADTISLQVKHVAGGNYHASIRIAPDDGSAAYTLGAGPNSAVFVPLGLATLVSDRNRPGDTGPQAWSVALDPGSQGEEAAIRRLKALDAGYCDCLGYEGFPDAGDSNYNSNGYARGLMIGSGLYLPAQSGISRFSLPGWNKPVPLPLTQR
jgi:hypothetical protein